MSQWPLAVVALPPKHHWSTLTNHKTAYNALAALDGKHKEELTKRGYDLNVKLVWSHNFWTVSFSPNNGVSWCCGLLQQPGTDLGP